MGRIHVLPVVASREVGVMEIGEAGKDGMIGDVEFIVIAGIVHRAPAQPTLGGMHRDGKIAALPFDVDFRQYLVRVPVNGG